MATQLKTPTVTEVPPWLLGLKGHARLQYRDFKHLFGFTSPSFCSTMSGSFPAPDLIITEMVVSNRGGTVRKVPRDAPLYLWYARSIRTELRRRIAICEGAKTSVRLTGE